MFAFCSTFFLIGPLQQLKTMMTAGRWIASSIFIISERRQQRRRHVYRAGWDTVPHGIPCRSFPGRRPPRRSIRALCSTDARGGHDRLGASARLRVVSEPKRATCNMQHCIQHVTVRVVSEPKRPRCISTDVSTWARPGLLRRLMSLLVQHSHPMHSLRDITRAPALGG